MKPLELLKSCGGPQDVFEVVQTSGDPDTWTAELRARGTAAFPLSLSKSSQDVRTWMVSRMDIPSKVSAAVGEFNDIGIDLPGLVRGIEDSRAGAVTCTLSGQAPTGVVEIRAVVYEDGFSQHTLNMAVLEIARTRRALSNQFDEIVSASERAKQAQKMIAEAAPGVSNPVPEKMAPPANSPAPTAPPVRLPGSAPQNKPSRPSSLPE